MSTLRTCQLIEPEIRSHNDGAVDRSKGIAENEALVEGQSSLAAHSEFAIGILHNAIGSQRGVGDGSEITGLLDTLRHMLDTFHHQRLSPKLLFPLANAVSPESRGGCPMPPLEAVFAVIHNAQEENNFMLLCLSDLLRPRSMSDVCLKVYFPKEFSDAEFIIVNAAMLSFHPGHPYSSSSGTNGDEQLQLMCRTNLETMFSRLSLFVKASYDMIIGLILGAIYAIDISNPSLAWALVGAASQSSHYLGLHTYARYVDTSSPKSTQGVLLFWVVYFLEKTLCLRVGRSSTIPHCDITAPWPGDLQECRSDALEYFHQQGKIASLAGRIYEQLYSGHALQLSGDTRMNRAVDLAE